MLLQYPRHMTLLVTPVTMLVTMLAVMPTLPQGRAQQVPVRVLLAEQADAGQGEAAIVHTHYGTGYGFFLTDKAEVLVARHSVLTPQRTIADEIDVRYPQRPFNNFIQSRSVPIAQDVVHDLVLLQIAGGTEGTDVADTKADAKADAKAIAASPVAVPPVQVPAATPPCTPVQHVRHVHAHRRHGSRRRSYLRQAVFTRASTKVNLRRTLAFSRNPRLHIVWDGPDAGSR